MDAQYYYWLHNVSGIGRHTYQKILKYVTPGELYQGGIKKVSHLLREEQIINIEESILTWNISKEWEILQRRNINVLGLLEKEYPEKLSQINDSPPVLYCKGKAEILNKPSVAVIGARGCSNYGSLMAKELGQQLANMGIVVVSGMARGVDSICQSSCLEQGGESIGVLGSGVEVCYPPEQERLYQELQIKGALVSENLPYTKPAPGLFPLRNRIISGLADLIVVVEAREKSGTLITVDMALEQGKEVYAIPGRITDPVSKGCNQLLKQGAGMIYSIEEFILDICPQLQVKYEKEKEKMVPNLTREERKILAIVDVTYKTIEEIYGSMKKEYPSITIVGLMEILLGLQIKQILKEEGGYYYRNSLKG